MSGGLHDPLVISGHPTSFEPGDTFKFPEKKLIPEGLTEKETETYIERELKARFNDIGVKGDPARVLMEIVAISALLNAQSKTECRRQVLKMLTSIIEETEVSASKYNSKNVWMLAAAGAGISILCSGAAAAAISTTVAKGVGDSQAIYNAIQSISALQSGGNALGQFLGTASQLEGQRLTGERTILDGRIQLLTLVRDKLKEYDSTDARRAQESLELIMRIVQTYHDTCMKANGGN